MNRDRAVVVALGCSLAGDYPSRRAALEAALDELTAAGLRVVKVSRWWRSAAWPDPADPEYLNGVAIVETKLGPDQTLGVLHAVEVRFGRERGKVNAPRTLDLDLIAYDRLVRAGPPALPHPRASERLFVMGPLAEIAPGWRHPINGETALALAARASVGTDARPA
ncbi:2-amino-4-hydroxy-6-hydroxymethyldihydropteridinediphosphokinase [soil metagenome]